MDNYIAKKSTKADAIATKNFLANNFGEDEFQNKPQWLEWQLKHPYSSYLQLIKNQDNAIVALSFFLQTPLNVKGNIKKAAFSTSTIVSKEHRRKGLGGKIHVERLKAFDFALSSGQSDANAALYKKKGFKSFGQYHSALIQKRFPKFSFSKQCLINILAYTKFFFTNLITQKNNLKVIEVDDLPTNLDEELFNQRLNVNSAVFPVHSGDYIKWRYLQHPYLTYKVYTVIKDHQIIGIVISREEDNQCNIIDLYAANRNMRIVLKAFARNCKIAKIYSLYVGREIQSIFEGSGALCRIYGPHYIGSSSSADNLSECEHLDWCIFWGDSDRDR